MLRRCRGGGRRRDGRWGFSRGWNKPETVVSGSGKSHRWNQTTTLRLSYSVSLCFVPVWFASSQPASGPEGRLRSAGARACWPAAQKGSRKWLPSVAAIRPESPTCCQPSGGQQIRRPGESGAHLDMAGAGRFIKGFKAAGGDPSAEGLAGAWEQSSGRLVGARNVRADSGHLLLAAAANIWPRNGMMMMRATCGSSAAWGRQKPSARLLRANRRLRQQQHKQQQHQQHYCRPSQLASSLLCQVNISGRNPKIASGGDLWTLECANGNLLPSGAGCKSATAAATTTTSPETCCQRRAASNERQRARRLLTFASQQPQNKRRPDLREGRRTQFEM